MIDEPERITRMKYKKIFVIVYIFVSTFLWSCNFIFYKINQDQYVILKANAIEKYHRGYRSPVYLVVEYEIDGKQMTGSVIKPLGVTVGNSLEIAVNLSGKDIVIPRLYLSKDFLWFVCYDVLFLSILVSLYSEEKNIYSIWNKDKCNKIIEAKIIKTYQGKTGDRRNYMDCFSVKCEYINPQGKRYIFKSKKVLGMGRLKEGDSITVKVDERNYHNYIVLLTNEHLHYII